MICPECDHERKIISFIVDMDNVEKILRYLDLWEEESSRDPPKVLSEIVYVPVDDGWDSEMTYLVS